MSDKMKLFTIGPDELLGRTSTYKASGYRLVQIHCTKVNGFELTYTFDKDHKTENLRMIIPEEQELQSISGIYWLAFLYENELKDLFGVKVVNLALDFGGTLYKVSEKTPWNPKN